MDMVRRNPKGQVWRYINGKRDYKSGNSCDWCDQEGIPSPEVLRFWHKQHDDGWFHDRCWELYRMRLVELGLLW